MLPAMRDDADAWSRWLLRDRFAGDHEAMAEMLEALAAIRDQVLDGADLRPGDVLLDVGTGDGLIGFGALERVGPDGGVVFSDVSIDLLDACREIASRGALTDRCRFVEAAAEDLGPVDDASVDAVTTRSVLIYVDDKDAAFREFRRVLRPGGRLSLFEPVNHGIRRLSNESVWGYDARDISDIADKLKAVYDTAVGGDSGAMLGFDSIDLVAAASRAGFEGLRAQVHITQRDGAYLEPTDWSAFEQSRPNPLAPTARDAIDQALTAEEARRLREHLESQVQAGTGRHFTVGCFLQGSIG